MSISVRMFLTSCVFMAFSVSMALPVSVALSVAMAVSVSMTLSRFSLRMFPVCVNFGYESTVTSSLLVSFFI